MTLKTLLAMVKWRCVIAFIVVILGQLITGSYNSFNVTLIALKEKFNYTQTEVELVLSAMPLGFGSGMPTGILLDRIGPRLTSVTGLLIITPGLCFMYLATITEKFFHDKAWLLAIIFFTAVELVLSAMPLGFGSGMPTGILLDRIGPGLTSVTGLLIITPGLCFMYLATITEEFFHDRAWLLAIIFFIAGQGMFVTFIISWTTGARQADPRIRGLLFGILKSTVIGSPALFTPIYDFFFKNGHVKDPINQDVGGYILFILISFVTVDVLTFIFVKDNSIQSMEIKDISTDTASEYSEHIPVENAQRNEIELMLSNNENEAHSNTYGSTSSNKGSDVTLPRNTVDNSDRSKEEGPSSHSLTAKLVAKERLLNKGFSNEGFEPTLDSPNVDQEQPQQLLHASNPPDKTETSASSYKEDIPLVPNDIQTNTNHTPFLNVLKDPAFQSLTWVLSFGLTSDVVIYANIGVITLSVDLQAYNTGLMVLSRVITCGVAFLSGVFLNCVPQPCLRHALLTVGTVVIIIANALFVISTKHPWILFAGLSCLGIGTGMLWVVGAGLMFSLFGSKDYGRNWGFVIMTAFSTSLVISVIVGRMYDAKISVLDSRTCIGEHCVRDWFITLGSLSFLSALLSFVRLFIMLRRGAGRSSG